MDQFLKLLSDVFEKLKIKNKYLYIVYMFILSISAAYMIPPDKIAYPYRKYLQFLPLKSTEQKIAAMMFPDRKKKSAKYTICLDNQSDNNLENLKIQGRISGKGITVSCVEAIDVDYKKEPLKEGKVFINVNSLPQKTPATIIIESKTSSEILEDFVLLYNNNKVKLAVRDLSANQSNFNSVFNEYASKNIASNAKKIGIIEP